MEFNFFNRTFYFLADKQQMDKAIDMLEKYFIKPEVLILLIILVVYLEFRFAAFVLKKERLRSVLRKMSPWVYLLFILGLTVFNRSAGMREIRILPDALITANGFHESNVLTDLVNLVFYVPYGFLLYKWGKYKRQYITVSAIVLGTSLLSEILQYVLSRGVTATDDLIMNLIGGCLGAALAMLLMKKKSRRQAAK